MIMVEYQSDMDIVFRDIDLLKCRTFGVVHRYGAPVLLKQCVVLRACSSVLPIVKFLGSTLRRRRPLLPGSCSLSYTGKFLFYFFTHFRYSCCLWGFSLNDMMTVAADDDDNDDDDDNEETASD